MNAKLVWAFLAGAALVALVMFLAYGKPGKVQPTVPVAQEQAPAPTPANVDASAPREPEPESQALAETPVREPADRPAEKPAPPPAPKAAKKPEQPAAPTEVSVLAGTILKAALEATLTSHESKAGDRFTLKVTEPVVVAGYIAIPAGATVEGEVVDARGSGRVSGHGEITLAFRSVTDATGTARTIEADTFYGQAEGAGGRDAAIIAGGAAAGAVVGGIVGKTKGAVVGGLIGAAAGTGTVLATKGPEVKLTPGSIFGIHLNKSLHLPAGPREAH